jgi:hypothetical protein
MTLFVPVQGYVHQLEQLIAIQYRVGTPQEAEPLQHELQRVIEYNHKTHSGFYPVYLVAEEATGSATPKGDENATEQTDN